VGGRWPSLTRPLGLVLLARVEEGEHPGRVFVFFVEPLGFLGLHICNDASTIGDASPGVGAARAA
jgi:hypothetical protein